MEKYVVTISRQFASMGRSIAQKMSEELQIEFYDRDIVEATASRMGASVPVISREEESLKSAFLNRKFPLGMGIESIQNNIFDVQTNIIRDFAKKESCIIVGRCANSILKDHPNCLNIFIYAPYEQRFLNCINNLKMDVKEAKRMIKDVDRAREKYRLRFCNEVENAYDGYDIMVDSSRFGVEETARMLTNIVKNRLIK